MNDPKLSLQETLEKVATGELSIADAYFTIASDITSRVSNAYMQGYDDGRVGLDDLFSEDE
jgi:hypothetical protein